MAATHVPVAYLYLNCKILEERFAVIFRRLQRVALHSKSDSSKVNRYLLDLGTIIDEIQRCDFFWSKYLAMNYYFAIFTCCICFLCGKFRKCKLELANKQFLIFSSLFAISSWKALYSDDTFMILCSTFNAISDYIATLVIAFFACGKLSYAVSILLSK